MEEMYKLYSDGRDSMLYFHEWESTSRFTSVCLFYLIETINSVNSMFIHYFPIILSKYLLCYTLDILLVCMLQFFLMWLNSFEIPISTLDFPL